MLPRGPGFQLDPNTYLATGPSGAIEAISLVTGKTLWRSDRAARLIGVHEGQPVGVTAEPGRKLRIALFHTSKGLAGKTRLISPPLPLPDFANVPPDPSEGVAAEGGAYWFSTLGGSSAVAYAGAERGALLVDWEVIWNRIAGAAPHPGETMHRFAVGRVKVNASTGALTELRRKAWTAGDRDPQAVPLQEWKPSVPASWPGGADTVYEVAFGEPAKSPTNPMLTTQPVLLRAKTKGRVRWEKPLAPVLTYLQLMPP